MQHAHLRFVREGVEAMIERSKTDQEHRGLVEQRAVAAGLPALELTGHSRRAGFVTAAASGGADYPAIMDQTGQEPLNTVHGYNRRKDKWKKPDSAKLGL